MKDGGPAYPMQALAAPGSEVAWGMPLRDWFAGQEVLEDECADLSTETMEALAGRPWPGASGPGTTAKDRLDVLAWNADWRAGLKFLRADAMLRARERGQEWCASVKADGGPAFPLAGHDIFIRDWFAGQALVGMLSGYVGNLNRTCTGIVNIDPRSIAVAYDIADAMLRARERGQEGGAA